jgi:hypothetical protein
VVFVNPNPVWDIPVDFGYPWGIQNISTIFSDIIDNSELETEEHERWIRHTVRFTLQAYMFEVFDTPNDVPYDQRPRTVQDIEVTYEIDEDPERTTISANKGGKVEIKTEVI